MRWREALARRLDPEVYEDRDRLLRKATSAHRRLRALLRLSERTSHLRLTGSQRKVVESAAVAADPAFTYDGPESQERRLAEYQERDSEGGDPFSYGEPQLTIDGRPMRGAHSFTVRSEP